VAVENEQSSDSSESLERLRQTQVSTPVVAALIFGVFGAMAAFAANAILVRFAIEAGVSTAVFVSVPALFAGLFALIVYQGADRHVERVNQSLTRGLLVAILTWIAFSWLATWAWCKPEDYASCFSGALTLSGLVGGGPLLLAAMLAGGVVGWVIQRRKATSWTLKD
jgi:hypothetical protein